MRSSMLSTRSAIVDACDSAAVKSMKVRRKKDTKWKQERGAMSVLALVKLEGERAARTAIAVYSAQIFAALRLDFFAVRAQKFASINVQGMN